MTIYAKWTDADSRFFFSLDSTLPDAVKLTDAEHAAIVAAQSAGKIIQRGSDGKPVAVDVPVSDLLARAIAEIRAERAPMLDALAGIAGRAQRASDTSTAGAADQAATDLLNITMLPALLAANTYDDMKAAVMTEYRRIAGNAPTSVQSAFVEVLGS